MIKKKPRQSNIELLRILSMLLIVIYHFLKHSIIPNTPNLIYITNPLIAVLHSGVICFILISGYWGIKFSLKGFAKLFLYCAFYSVIIYVIAVLLDPSIWNVYEGLSLILPIQWWFIPVYMCLYLLTPVINIPLKSASNQTKLFFILILILVSFCFGQFIPSLEFGKNPINFILIYYVGNYLRTGLILSKNYNAKKLLGIYILFVFLLFSSMLFGYLYIPNVGKILFRLFYPYNSIGLIINSVLFFLIFTKIKFSSKLINWFSSSTLAVYLIHENQYLSHYLYDFVIKLQNNIDNYVVLAFTIVILAILVFVVSVLIDKLISPLFQILIRFITESNIFIKVDDRIQDLLKF
ncbi:acyltransferase [uncultured Winogradskyella sp.]|uniref:acyltransferase n=1 Tax=uncultured Winogradskyella sp. TaxID=395353 RepID=UPI0030EC24F9|tara:strand:+ start:2051 stop:3103 length:1053 start_codon:yes stop_codon:yes gene_type:complete